MRKPMSPAHATAAIRSVGRCGGGYDLSTYSQSSTSLKSNALARLDGGAVKKCRDRTVLEAVSRIPASIVACLHVTRAETPLK